MVDAFCSTVERVGKYFTGAVVYKGGPRGYQMRKVDENDGMRC